jgi:hypothetical protein
MTALTITAMEPGWYGVQVDEGHGSTSHRVRVDDDFGDWLWPDEPGPSDPEVVVEESFKFLLDREPATSILREFSLEQIADFFPDYRDELRRRLTVP